MGNADVRPAAGGHTPHPDNADLLEETLWIAAQTGVLRRNPRTREWEPDLDELGNKISRSTGAFKALRTGGHPTLLIVRLLARYATERIAGYNPVRLAGTLGIFTDDDVAAYARSLPAGPLHDITEDQLEEARRSAGFSAEDRDLLRDYALFLRERRRQRAQDAAQAPNAPPSEQDPTAAPDTEAQ